VETITGDSAKAVRELIRSLDLVDMLGTVELGFSAEIFRTRVAHVLQLPVERCNVGMRTSPPSVHAMKCLVRQFGHPTGDAGP
jgi:hypothetical protein